MTSPTVGNHKQAPRSASTHPARTAFASRARLAAYVPILQWLPGYNRGLLRGDVIAGITIVALAVPESLGYAQIAGVPVEAGLYATLGALVGYALFGSSRQLVVGATSTLAVLSAATIATLAPAGSSRFIALTAGLAIATALVALVAGLARLGFVAQFLAEPVLTGFIFGVSMTIAVRQVPKLFGVQSGDGNFFQRLWDLVTHLGETNGWTLAIGVASLATLFLLKRFARGVPAALVVVVASIVVTSLFGLEQRGVEIVGDIPRGLPSFGVPAIAWNDLLTLLSGAVGLTLVAYAEHVGAASSFAAKHHQEIDPNQELVGLGVANLFSGLSQGFVVGGSLSKSAANDAAGGRTQVAGLSAAVLVVLTMLVLTPLFHSLPEAALGAIVIFAVWGLMDVAALRRYARLSRTDFVLALIALVGELTLDVLPGLLLAVVLSLLVLIYRASRPNLSVLGRAPDGRSHGDVVLHTEYRTVPTLLVVRVDAPLFFANGATVRDGVRGLVREAMPPPIEVILDLEATNRLDVSSADMLSELATELNGMHITLALARVRTPVREMLERAGSPYTNRDEGRIYPTVEAGIDEFERLHAVQAKQ